MSCREKTDGFSIMEVLISISLLGIIATLSAQMVMGTFNSIGRERNKGQCSHIAQSVIGMIDRIGTRDRVLASVMPGPGQLDSDLSTLNAQVLPEERFLLPTWFAPNSSLPLITNVNGYTRVNNSQLIVSSINMVQNFYNQNPSACTNRDGVSILNQLRGAQMALPGNILDVRLKINPFDLTTRGPVGGAACPPPPLIVSPQRFDKKVVSAGAGQSNDHTLEGFVWGADSSVGFNLSVQVSIQGTQRTEVCGLQKAFHHDRDQSNPTIVETSESPTSADGTGLWTSVGPNQFIGPGMNSIELPIRLSNLERGSIVLCGDPVSNGSRLSDCPNISLVPVGGGPSRTPAAVQWDPSGRATFRFTNLPDSKVYRLSVAGIDTSGNRTPAFVAQFEARPCPGETVNPANCPMEFDCPLSANPPYAAGPRVACMSTNAGAISRYGAVTAALRFRNLPVCIAIQNFFASDGACGGAGDDPKFCADLGGGMTRQKCLDAAGNNPFLTVGNIYRDTFNHHAVSFDEASVFAYRATIQASCGEQIMRDILDNNDGQQLARQTYTSNRGYPVTPSPVPPIPRTASFWSHVYVALKVGGLTVAEATQAHDLAPGGPLPVSAARMNQMMTSMAGALAAAGGCSNLRNALLTP